VASEIVKTEQKGDTTWVTLAGELNAEAVATCWDEVLKQGPQWQVDASGVVSCDGAGLALLWTLQKEHGAAITGLKPELETLLKPFDNLDKEKPQDTSRGSAIESLGRLGYGFYQDTREQIAFIGEVLAVGLACAVNPKAVRWADMWVIAQRAGVDALVVAGMVSFLTGMIMAFQAATPLRQFGVDIFAVNLVALALLRELGPIMTAVVFAGRSGSAFAAEIGTMKVNEELDALRTMGLDPVRFLVIPRIIAGFIVVPALTVYASALGVVGGFVVMMMQGFPFAALWNQLVSAVGVHDILTGIIKSFVFGILVAGVGCLRGLQTGKGASAVGESTTRAVVSAIVLIVFVDAIFAGIFFVIKW